MIDKHLKKNEWKIKSLISIIIPVYNAEIFLTQCLESLLSQTYQNIEILLIDDGSTDRSGEICKAFHEKDGRIRYYRKINEGCSVARNFGLNMCNGEYVAFLDADDYVTNEYLECLFNNLQKNDVDISVCNYKEICGQMSIQSCRLRSQLIEYDEQLNFCKLAPVFIYVWGKLFRKELLEGLYFDKNICVGEDSLFSIYAAKKSGRIYFDSKILYMYRIHQDSVSHQKNITKQKTSLIAWEKISQLQPKDSIAYWSARLYYLKGYRQFINLNEQEVFLFQTEWKKYWKSILIINDHLKEKILLILLACFPTLYFKFYKKSILYQRNL